MEIVADGRTISNKQHDIVIDDLPNKVARELERYVKQCLISGSKGKKGAKLKVNLDGIK